MRELLQNVYAQSRAELLKSRNVQELKAHVGRFHAQADDLAAHGFAAKRATLACHAGCDYCCYLKVDARAGEVFRIVDYMRQHFAPERIAEVRSRAEENRQRIAPMTAEQHLGANLACALLQDGQCSVYPVRPFQCRAFHAQTVQTCKASFEQPERLDLPHSQVAEVRFMLNAASETASQAMHDSGYDTQVYDLNAALVEALDSGRGERRWKDGKSAFSRGAVAKDAR